MRTVRFDLDGKDAAREAKRERDKKWVKDNRELMRQIQHDWYLRKKNERQRSSS